MKRFTSFAIAIAFSLSAPAFAQQSSAADAARQDAVVKQAMRDVSAGPRRHQGVAGAVRSRARARATLRELRLEEAVSLALEKNLDIQVAKLEPQSVDFQIAGFRNQFQPVLASTVGQRDLFQLPTRTINGGTRVNQATTTYNASVDAGSADASAATTRVAWTNQRVALVGRARHSQPALHDRPGRAATCSRSCAASRSTTCGSSWRST